MRICNLIECENKHLAKGYCRKHYLRLYKHGTLKRKGFYNTPLMTRLTAKILQAENGCWIYTGAINQEGYGAIRNGPKMASTHVTMYEHHNGPVPEGLELDHLCRIRKCCNPFHLEAVTHKENIRRGNSGIGWEKRTRDINGRFAKEKRI